MDSRAKKTATFTGLKPTGRTTEASAAQSEFSSGHDRRPFTVFLVMDDDQARAKLTEFLQAQGIEVREYMTAMEFYRDYREKIPGVLVTDVRLRGLTGTELHEKLLADNKDVLVVYIAGPADAPTAIAGLTKGALDFLLKPVQEEQLLAAVARAYAAYYNVDWEFVGVDRDDLVRSLARITGREREILELIVEGNSSRAISVQLDISVKTVEAHRARINDKMRADDLAHLVRMVMAAKEE